MITNTTPSKPLKEYFTQFEWVLWALLIFLGIAFRWSLLGDRPLHHDESIHAMFGKYFYDFPDFHYYKYNPEYHGPTFYLLLVLTYNTIGATDFTARAPIAFIGTLLIFTPLLFRRYLLPKATLIVTAALSLSPTLIYWSRFAREDYLVYLGMFSVLYGVVCAARERKALFVFLGIALNYATKANVFVFMALLLGYFIYERYFGIVLKGIKGEESKSENSRFEYGLSLGAGLIVLSGLAAIKPDNSIFMVASSLGLTVAISLWRAYQEGISSGFGGKVSKELGRWSPLFVAGPVFALYSASLSIPKSVIWYAYTSWLWIYNAAWSALDWLTGVFSKPFGIAFKYEVTAVPMPWDKFNENYGFIALGLGAFLALLSLFLFNKEEGLLLKLRIYIRENRLLTAISFLIAAFLFSFIMTSGFRHMQGILDGLYRASISYWMDKHNIERIKGPFNFHLYQLSWYEFLFMIAFCVHYFLFYKEIGWRLRLIAAAGWVAALGVFLYYRNGEISESAFGKFFKLKDELDGVGVIVLLLHPLFVTSWYLFRGDKILAFFGYYFTANLFTYSYLGEKVPWLSTYPFLGGVMFLTLYFQDYLSRNPVKSWREYDLGAILRCFAAFFIMLGVLFLSEELSKWSKTTGEFSEKTLASIITSNIPYLVAGALLLIVGVLDKRLKMLGTTNLYWLGFAVLVVFNARIAFISNYVTEEREIGFISQVHTTREFKNSLNEIRKLTELKSSGAPRKIFVTGEPVWPATWYFRGVPEYQFQELGAEPEKNIDYILDTWKEGDQDAHPGFAHRRLNLRGWWVPEYEKMTLKRYLDMSINLRPFSGIGYSYTSLYVNKRLLPSG